MHGRRHPRHVEEVYNDFCLKAIYPLFDNAIPLL